MCTVHPCWPPDDDKSHDDDDDDGIDFLGKRESAIKSAHVQSLRLVAL